MQNTQTGWTRPDDGFKSEWPTNHQNEKRLCHRPETIKPPAVGWHLIVLSVGSSLSRVQRSSREQPSGFLSTQLEQRQQAAMLIEPRLPFFWNTMWTSCVVATLLSVMAPACYSSHVYINESINTAPNERNKKMDLWGISGSASPWLMGPLRGLIVGPSGWVPSETEITFMASLHRPTGANPETITRNSIEVT